MRTHGAGTRVLGLAVAIAVLATLAAVVSRSGAGADKIEFPAKYNDGVLYTIADRYDVKQYRELYASASAVQAAKEGKPLPSGTVLTLIQYKAQVDAQGNPLKDANGRFLKGDLIAYAVMEKRTGWGTEYPDNIRNGEWEYQAFKADKTPNPAANLTACFNCHKPLDKQDFVFTYDKLKTAAK
jgi:Cytochrome P460